MSSGKPPLLRVVGYSLSVTQLLGLIERDSRRSSVKSHDLVGLVNQRKQVAARETEHLSRGVLNGWGMARCHERLEHGKVRHELCGTGQRILPLLLDAAKSLHRDGEIDAQVTPNLVLHTALHDQQRRSRQSRGSQQHGNQEFCSKSDGRSPRLVVMALSHKLVSGAMDGAEMYGLAGVLLKLLPQSQDMRVHRPGRGVAVVSQIGRAHV